MGCPCPRKCPLYHCSSAITGWSLMDGHPFSTSIQGRTWKCSSDGVMARTLYTRYSSDAGSIAPRHVGPSRTTDRTHVPYTGRWILNHWTTREIPVLFYMMKTQAAWAGLPQSLEARPAPCLFPRQAVFKSSRGKFPTAPPPSLQRCE